MLPTCCHIKENGIRCQSPVMHGAGYCYHHLRYQGMRLWTGRLERMAASNLRWMQTMKGIFTTELQARVRAGQEGAETLRKEGELLHTQQPCSAAVVVECLVPCARHRV